MELLFYGLLFLTSLSVIQVIGTLVYGGRGQIKNRLTFIAGMADTSLQEEDEEALPFKERVITPLYNKLLYQVGRVAPSSIRQNYNMWLDASGLRAKVSYTNLLMIQILLSLLLMMSFQYLAPSSYRANGALYLFALGGLGLGLPYLVVRQKAFARKDQIEQALPGFLDLIYVSVEAGLSFDMAIHRTMHRLKGPISEEFIRTMDEIRHGKGRAAALRGLANRTQVGDLQEFVTSIIQAEELGSNIGNVLRVQSQTMRQLRKQRAEEKAAKIPTKMTFPLVLLMFPSLFIVILGPAAINIIANLM